MGVGVYRRKLRWHALRSMWSRRQLGMPCAERNAVHFLKRSTLLLCVLSSGCLVDYGGDFDSACPPGPYSCSIEDVACAEAVLEMTACERGDIAPALPTIKRMTRLEYGEYMRRKLDEEDVGPSPWDPVLRAFGLLSEEEGLVNASISQAVKDVAAFYDSENKQIGIITDSESESGDPQMRMYTLSHELTHYLQDQAHDLQWLHDETDSTDRDMVLGMLLEGDALVTSTRVLMNIKGVAPHQFSFPDYFNQLEPALLADIFNSRSPLLATIQNLPYVAGGRYVARRWSDRGRDGVDSLFYDDDAPPTAADWLAQGGSLVPRVATDERLACAPPPPPEGFELFILDHFGAAGIVAMLASIFHADFDLAASLDDDALAVYTQQGAPDPASAPVIGIWRLRFANPEASERFFRLFEHRDVGIRRAGSDLLMRVSSVPELAQWQASELEACPTLEELAPMQAEPTPPTAALRRLFHP